MDSCNGYARHLSVVLQPYQGKPIAESVISKLDEFDFVRKHRVLPQEDNLGFRKFKPWLDVLVRLNADAFMKPFERR